MLGTFFGQYNKKIKGLYHPYLSPQKNGNRVEAQWVKFIGKGLPNLYLLGKPIFDFNAQFFS